MKKILILLCLLASGYSMAGEAFGTYKGMTKEDLERKGVSLEKTDSNTYMSASAPISNKNFIFYKYSFDASNKKLCIVSGFSRPISSDRYGTEIKDKINDIKDLLEKKYGEPIFINELGLSKDLDWMDILKNEQADRVYTYIWNKNTDLKYHKNIFFMVLSPSKFKESAIIKLEYFLEDKCNLYDNEEIKGL